MINLIEELKQFVKEHKNQEDKYTYWFNGASLDVEMKIPYKQAEFIVEVIEQLEESCNEANKYYEMIMDYNRLLKNENEDLRKKLYGQF